MSRKSNRVSSEGTGLCYPKRSENVRKHHETLKRSVANSLNNKTHVCRYPNLQTVKVVQYLETLPSSVHSERTMIKRSQSVLQTVSPQSFTVPQIPTTEKFIFWSTISHLLLTLSLRILLSPLSRLHTRFPLYRWLWVTLNFKILSV